MIRINKIKTMFMKDFDDIIKTKYIAASLIALPILMIIIVPLSFLLPMMLDPTGFQSGDMAFLSNFPLTSNWSSLDEFQQSFVFFVEIANIFYVMIPFILPTIIAADSFSGEKDRGTVEALVAAPITDSELYIGKVASAVIPTVGMTWLFCIPQIFMINVFSIKVLGYYYLPNLQYLIIVVLLTPAVTLLMTNVMIWASTRTNTARDSQQMGSLIALPLMFLVINFSTLALVISETILLVGVVIVYFMAYGSYIVGLDLLDRERWLSYTK